ncbi:uncharacterized protein LOC130276558 [Hyla sarda]|uniref:uncharacterized protein LOC130276558 n=1 Tax=Hyla sarda TaxID=327740 RepID=UPI0024C41E87|nr:uncharacterized protein LOC130276558 [Hyla sarda]
MSITHRQKLYQDYISHYESRSYEGNVTLCDQELECRGDTVLCDSPAALGESYTQLIRQNLQSQNEEHRVEVLKQMKKGFAVLELICVNLFLFPWRKEIRTLKKFTGSFVYFVKPIIPENIIQQILQQVGYSKASETAYIMTGKINSEEAKQTAFELYLARIHCDKLLWHLNENKSVSVSLLVNGPSTEANSANENSSYAGKKTSRITDVHKTDRINNLDFQSNVTNNNDTIKDTDLTLTNTSSHDFISDTSKKDTSYYMKHMDSDEFLAKYSDLNLAQQPIFPLHIKQNKPKQWAAPVSEPNFEHHIPESIVIQSELAISDSKDLAEKATCDLQADNIDVRTFTDNLETPKSLIVNEHPAETIVLTKQERVVTKLKMQNMAGESLAYPVEETLPPDSTKFPNSSDMGRKEVKWAFLKTKEGAESFATPMPLSSDFSMLNISSKSAVWTPGTENRLREPPNSTYIPPMALKSELTKLTNTKPEENHFQAPSPPEGTLLVNEFKVLEDTKEDYVMITRKDPLQN